MTEESGWRAIEFRVSKLVPAADKAGIRLACHPHDPAYPIGGLNGVEHVLGSIEGMRKFIALSDSPNHGLNFCQGTVAEMAKDPTAMRFAPLKNLRRAFSWFISATSRAATSTVRRFSRTKAIWT